MMTRNLLWVGLVLSLWGAARADEAKTSSTRFAFVGCNRIGFTELDDEDNPSSANREQLLRTLSDLAAAPPSHLFLVGDIVTNYAHGAETLRGQLEAWVDLYQRSDLAQTETILVPIVGNHEVLTSVQDPKTGKWKDYPNPETLPVWEKVLAPYLRWSDGPTLAGDNPDRLTHDQSRLSFTVRHGDVLFICINTDTFVDDITIGDVPITWIAEKLREAEADETVRHVFLLGHKPVISPDLPGDLVRDLEFRPLDGLMANSSKVRAFLTAHFHLWDCRRTEEGVLQVIAGNGGTRPSGQFNADGKGYFGYTVVEVNDDGSFMIENWGRPVPTPYNSDEPQPPARLLERLRAPATRNGW